MRCYKVCRKDDICVLVLGDTALISIFNKYKHYELEDVDGMSLFKRNMPLIEAVKVKKLEEVSLLWDEESETMKIMYKEIDGSVFNALDILINSLMIRELEKKGRYVLHSSSIYDYRTKNALVLWGDSGAGKTTIMLDLVENYDFGFISNGSVIIKNGRDNFQICGTYKRNIKLRASSLYQYNAFEFEKFFKSNSNFEKKDILPKDLGIKEWKNSNQVNLVSCYFVKLCNAPFNINTALNYRISMQLFKDISRHLKFSDLYLEINGKGVYVPSIDNKRLYKNRISFINNYLKKCFKGHIHGNLPEVTNFLLNQ